MALQVVASSGVTVKLTPTRSQGRQGDVIRFTATVKDGRGTRGLALPKSNWANPLDTPPYLGFAAAAVPAALAVVAGAIDKS